MKVYKIKVNAGVTITVRVKNGGGSIVSEGLRKREFESDITHGEASKDYNHAIDGLEALILGHVCAGIDVSAPAYIAGITSAIDAITNNRREWYHWLT
jgi:hypothetical protein